MRQLLHTNLKNLGHNENDLQIATDAYTIELENRLKDFEAVLQLKEENIEAMATQFSEMEQIWTRTNQSLQEKVNELTKTSETLSQENQQLKNTNQATMEQLKATMEQLKAKEDAFKSEITKHQKLEAEIVILSKQNQNWKVNAND